MCGFISGFSSILLISVSIFRSIHFCLDWNFTLNLKAKLCKPFTFLSFPKLFWPSYVFIFYKTFKTTLSRKQKIQKIQKNPSSVHCYKMESLKQLWRGALEYLTGTVNFFISPFNYIMYGFLTIGKDPDAGKDWGQEENSPERIGVTEDEMVGWHHWLHGSWVWANSRRWWRTGKPGVLWSMGLQRVGHDLVTEQQ